MNLILMEDVSRNHDGYYELDGIRLVVEEGSIIGWYRP